MSEQFLTFEEARKFVRTLGLKSMEEYREYFKIDKRKDKK